MQLALSTAGVLNAIFSNESGQVLYKTTHPHSVTGMTTLYKIKPSDDPTDMRDQFETTEQIKWHMVGSLTFRSNGQEMQSNEFPPSHGILGTEAHV